MLCVLRPAVSALLVVAISAPFLQPALAAAPPMTRADYEACQSADEAGFRKAIEALSLKALQAGVKTVDYRATVDREWRRAGMDDLLVKRVDLAIEEVRSETSWAGLAQSLIDTEKAQKMAADVAERVYQSEPMRVAVENLATGVGQEVGRALEGALQDAASPAVECMRAFLGQRYGTTVAGVVSRDVERDFGLDSVAGRATVSSGAVIQQSGEGIAGAALVLMRRQLANLTARIGQRLAGSILARLVSVAAGGVGVVLIAKDIWELRKGVLPIISDEMKSETTKSMVKEELAKTFDEQITKHLPEIASKSADRVIEIWQSFRNAHRQALDLAARNDDFRAFLDTVQPAQLARLDEVMALVLASGGEPGVLRRLGDGSLNEAVRFLPEPAMTIARETRSIDAALGWSQLAGDRLPAVIEHGVYKRADHAGFTRATLNQLLNLNDPMAIGRLAALEPAARERLFGLPAADLRRLARGFSEAELDTLSRYLVGLDPEPRDRILKAVAATPGKMQRLASSRVRDGLIASRDQARAVDMMLREGSGGPNAILADVEGAWEGQVSPILLWEKHPLPVVGFGFAIVVVLLMVRRLFRPRRKEDPAQTAA
ncbi:hypothetical protein [Hyphomicrobium sp.]|uniref:hypothetical protein n=1 Tax=Hyphomicrobium sp. TaxID=82 RepID=UPI002C916814|nr:hypothetical protein [Hyphomicrobium sp.]HRN88066.1 hypothetical protein [Hyphomicrobium sp.]HRQ25705.1 hypothetical protein [Hyphomicrobium sp.]